MPHTILSLGTFYGIDSLIDLLIILVAALISYESHKIYVLLKEKNFRYFSWAFFAIALAFICKIFSNLTASYQLVIYRRNFIVILIQEVEESKIIHFLTDTLHHGLLIVGFLILFLIMTREDRKEEIILFLYLSAIAILLGIYFNFVFHLTLVLILTLLSIYFYHNYKTKKTISSLLVYAAFVIILASHTVDLLFGNYPFGYLASEILTLIGFLILLVNHINLKNEQKKNEARSYSRHAGNFKKA